MIALRKAAENGDQWKEMQTYISNHTYFEEQNTWGKY